MGTEAGITGAAGGVTCTVTTGAVGGGCMGASAIFADSGGGSVTGCIGMSTILAAVGSEAARGGVAVCTGGCGATGFGTTRRLVREVDGATAAERAEGDSGVTGLDCRLSAGVFWVRSRLLRLLVAQDPVHGFFR